MAYCDYDKACDLVAEIENYCAFEEDEHGEAMRYLVGLAQYPDYITEDLWNAVVAALEWELENYKEHCRIVKTEETYTAEHIELEWD